MVVDVKVGEEVHWLGRDDDSGPTGFEIEGGIVIALLPSGDVAVEGYDLPIKKSWLLTDKELEELEMSK